MKTYTGFLSPLRTSLGGAALLLLVTITAQGDDIVRFQSGVEVRCKILHYKDGVLTAQLKDGRKEEAYISSVSEIAFDTEKELAEVERFALPKTTEEWDAVEGKKVYIDIQDYAEGKSIGLRVTRGDRVRIIPHPFEQWGGDPFGPEYWNGEHCYFEIGIPGKSKWQDTRMLLEQNMVYEAPADGRLHIKTARDVPSGFVNHLEGTICVKIVELESTR